MNWTAVASLLAALAAAAGVVFTGLSLQAARQQNAVTEQGQLTDRFTKAVDQLDRAGTDHLQARLGAIYALERLARDSPRDQPTIVEVLSAFIRTATPQPPPPPTATAGSGCAATGTTADAQAALTVLGRRNSAHDQTARVDLRRTCLRYYVNLAEANLRSAELADADLNHADLHSARLGGANLRHAQLGAADLGVADLSNADLGGARLHSADLRGTNLTDADLRGASHDRSTDVTDAMISPGTQGMWW